MTVVKESWWHLFCAAHKIPLFEEQPANIYSLMSVQLKGYKVSSTTIRTYTHNTNANNSNNKNGAQQITKDLTDNRMREIRCEIEGRELLQRKSIFFIAQPWWCEALGLKSVGSFLFLLVTGQTTWIRSV